MSASFLTLSPVQSGAPRNDELKSLEVEAKGDLEWRISEISARWLVAGRDIAEQDPSKQTQSDVVALKIRVAGLAYHAAMQVFCCTFGIAFCLMVGYMNIMFICIAQILAVGLVLVSTHIANCSRNVSLQCTTHVAAIMLIGISLFGTPFLWALSSTWRGWHWSTGVGLWKWASAIGAVFLLENPIRTGIVVFSICVVLDSVLIASSRLWAGELGADVVEYDTDTMFYAMLTAITTYALVPPVVALSFRRACQEYRWKLDAVRSQQERLDAFRASSRFLIFTLIPPVRATQLTYSSPALWHRGSHDTWEECSLVQFDVSGFTVMSSRIGSGELVGLINALFTSTEYAAECIGNIWMVELIGDCCKFMVGGPLPCADHPYRAAVLAYSISEVFKHVALRLGVTLTVRVGIHTGAVVGAVTGSSMPRYLLYGQACEMVGRMESNAPRGGVLASEAAAAALGDVWPHQEAQDFALADGTRITGRLSDAATVEGRMAAARQAYPALGKLLSEFETGEFDERLLSEFETGEDGEMTGSSLSSSRKTNVVAAMEAGGMSPLARAADRQRHGSDRVNLLRASERESTGKESRAADRLVRRIRCFTKWNSSVVLPRRTSLDAIVVERRSALVAFGGFERMTPAFLARPPSLDPLSSAASGATRSKSLPQTQSADVTTTTLITVEVEKHAGDSVQVEKRAEISGSRSCSEGSTLGGSRPSLNDVCRQLEAEVLEGGSCEGGMGGGELERGSEEPRQPQPGMAVDPTHAPSALCVPALHPKCPARRGTQDRPSGLRMLPDGRPPTRLLVPVEEAAVSSSHGAPAAAASIPEVSGSVVGLSLHGWQTELIGPWEEAVPVGATLDPALEVRAEAGWENQHGATPIAFQRSIVFLFIAVLTTVTGLHTAMVLVLYCMDEMDFYARESRAAQHLVPVLPALQLVMLLTAILVNKYSKLDWGSERPQTAALMLVFVSPSALEGSLSGRSSTSAAILWSGAAVLISCSTTPVNSFRWWWWMAAYWVVCFSLIWLEEHTIPGGAEPLTAETEWWRDMLFALHMWAVGALMMATLGLASNKVAIEQGHARELLHNTKREAFLEGKLLNALLPAGVIERFLRGDRLIADSIEEGTVMFIYINSYRETLLEHGTTATIQWINRVFEALDACIGRTSSIIKVETFNDFLLVYSKQPGTHLDECISLAIDMLDAIRVVVRPDGASTTVKLGASSGDFTAGIIGSSAPRYSIFGDTVNTASRMAALSRPCTTSSFFMHLSDTAREKVGAELERWLMTNLTMSILENGPGMEIKGKGRMQTFCLCKTLTDGGQERPSQRGRV